MDLSALFTWLESTDLAVFVQTSAWAFPAIEVVHVIAIVLVYGVIAVVDLRLLGVAGTSRRYAALAQESLHWVWAAFAIAVISGGLMFISQASSYAGNAPFQVKMIFIVLAGLNMLIMEFVISRERHAWGTGKGSIPIAGRVAGLLSLSFWTVVVVCGRWIGFTMFSIPNF